MVPDDNVRSLEDAVDDAPPEISDEGERSANQDDSIVTEVGNIHVHGSLKMKHLILFYLNIRT
jgi:hypothetical protein